MLRNANHANDRLMDSLLQYTFNSAIKFSEQLLNMFQMPTCCSEQIDFITISYSTDILQYQQHIFSKFVFVTLNILLIYGIQNCQCKKMDLLSRR
jgi:hypothetical protein